MLPAPTTPPVIHQVSCPHCGTRYDAMAAPWCSCISKERSLLCPLCLVCFCDAPASFKMSFWDHAPDELWRRRREMQRAEVEWDNPDAAEVKRPLVMVVDDDKTMRMILVARISSLGYGAISAPDGAEGLLLSRVYRPDLIITDALMPRMDGREMARQIREKLPGTHIVVMTSVYKSPQHKYEALRNFGADDYLIKPIQSKVLAEVLARFL